MPSDLTLTAAELVTKISATDFSNRAATVVGYGNMGKQYVKALQALGVHHIRVCSRSAEPLQELQGTEVEVIAGGFEQLRDVRQANELAIIATPTALLIRAAKHLVSLGFRRLLIEKPVSLWSNEIETLAQQFEQYDVQATVAYNRVAYPSFNEIKARVTQEGGVTSCTYNFTEIIGSNWAERFPPEELARWGIANSLHVIGMAHGLIGLPKTWYGHKSGALTWHPAGAVFVGSGVSTQDIPFNYHADWGSTGRWSVEVHTAVSSYRLCPLEQVYRRTAPLQDWEHVPVEVYAPDVKVGFVEQVAFSLMDDKQPNLLPSLRETVAITRYAEQIFGYGE